MPDRRYRRCPRCNALIPESEEDCPECRLLEQVAEPQPDGNRKWSNPAFGFLQGLGIPADLWIVTILWLAWFAVFCIAETVGHATVFTLAGIGFPLVLIAEADYFASLVNFGWGRQLDPIDPIAVKLFAWIVIIGSQIWFVYRLFGDGT